MSVSPINTLDTGTLQPTYDGDSSAWDTTPTSGSSKPVTSGGVYTAINEDTGWLTLEGTDNALNYLKTNKIVFIKFGSSLNVTTQAATWLTIGTMPEGFRPSGRIEIVGVTSDFLIMLLIRVNTNGTVQILTKEDTNLSNYQLRFSGSYPV